MLSGAMVSRALVRGGTYNAGRPLLPLIYYTTLVHGKNASRIGNTSHAASEDQYLAVCYEFHCRSLTTG